jgi:hypothetical protein
MTKDKQYIITESPWPLRFKNGSVVKFIKTDGQGRHWFSMVSGQCLYPEFEVNKYCEFVLLDSEIKEKTK